MPELPEVETVVRSIAPLITGRTIHHAEFRSRFITQSDFEETAKAIAGTRVESLDRQGKHIFIRLSRGVLHVHLGMTGKLLWNGDLTPYTRVVFEMNGGTLLFDDIRQFGRVNYYEQWPERFASLGPDALAVSRENFISALGRHRTGLKALLLDQTFLAGLGNIYADEVLFAARIHPRAKAARLSRKRAVALFEAMGQILQAAIAHRGSSISDYVDASGAQGSFQLLHQIYGKTGEPCPCCGSPIRRIVVGGRGTHYCPKCQRS